MGEASPARLLKKLRPSELGLWWALWQISPWGEDRADLRMGIQAALLANVNRNSKKQSQPFLPADFMPYYHATPKPADPRKLNKRLLKAFGLKLDRKKLKKKDR